MCGCINPYTTMAKQMSHTEYIRLHRWKSNVQKGFLEILAIQRAQLLCRLTSVKALVSPIGVEVTDNIHQHLH